MSARRAVGFRCTVKLCALADGIETQVAALRLKLPQYELETLVIDVLVFWSGNDLTGYYGVFLDPGFNENDYIWYGQVQRRFTPRKAASRTSLSALVGASIC